MTFSFKDSLITLTKQARETDEEKYLRVQKEIDTLESENPYIADLKIKIQEDASKGNWSYCWECRDDSIKNLDNEAIYRSGYHRLCDTKMYQDLSRWANLNELTLHVVTLIDMEAMCNPEVAYPFKPGVLELSISWREK